MLEKYTLIWSFRNRFDIFKKSIETADKFTPKDVDFCLVDAASSEDTIHKLREYCNTIKNRTVRICESAYRTNLSEAWNLGMMLTENRYVIFVSSDVEFLTADWFIQLSNHHKQTKYQYILMPNHAVFLIDKKIIPIMGWWDEEFGYGPHQDCDFMIRASEKGIHVSIISKENNHRDGDTPEEEARRTKDFIPDRLPLNTFENEDYFKLKWQTNWVGWRNYIGQLHLPHPPTYINQVKRNKPEINPHPLYDGKFL